MGHCYKTIHISLYKLSSRRRRKTVIGRKFGRRK